MTERVDDRSADTSTSEIVIGPCASPRRAGSTATTASTITTATTARLRRRRWRMVLLLERGADGTMRAVFSGGTGMNDRPIRVGFVGAGRNTRERHIPGFQKQSGVEFVAVANRSRESGERVAKQFRIGRVEDDWHAIMRAPDVDAVCIGTWPYTHCEMTLAALAAGKH